MSFLSRTLTQQWFLALLFFMVGLGLLYPQPGMWVNRSVGTTPFVFVLLFLTSMAFDVSQLLAGFRKPLAIVLSLSGTYLFMPALLYAAAWPLGLETPLGVGLVVMGAVPTTLASAAVWTRLAGGNAALCVAMVVISNALNCLVAPLVLHVTLGQVIDRPLLPIVQELVLIVLLPLALGQLTACWVMPRFWPLRSGTAVRSVPLRGGSNARPSDIVVLPPAWWIVPTSVLSRILLALVVLQAASRAAQEAGKSLSCGSADSGPSLTVGLAVLLVVLCVAVHALVVALLYILALGTDLAREDLIAVIMTGGQKTLPVGLTLLSQYFEQHTMGVLSMVVYHAVQLIFDTFLIELFRRRKTEIESPVPKT